MYELYTSLKSKTNLEYIRIENNKMLYNLKLLYKILENNPYLKYLFLSLIKSINLKLLSAFLKNNNTLKYLSLSNVELTNINIICVF